MLRTDFASMACSIAKAMGLIGETWTPLILRDLLLGFTGFEEIRTDLGISTNVLSDRLRTLAEHGVVERTPAGSGDERPGYRLTPKGEDAIPIVLAMLAWGDRWEAGAAGLPTLVVHERCGHPTRAVIHCSECGERLTLDQLTYHRGPGSEKGPGTELLQAHLLAAFDS